MVILQAIYITFQALFCPPTAWCRFEFCNHLAEKVGCFNYVFFFCCVAVSVLCLFAVPCLVFIANVALSCFLRVIRSWCNAHFHVTSVTLLPKARCQDTAFDV